MIRVIGITGTRLAVNHVSLHKQFDAYLRLFPNAMFYLGGAVGIDSLALVWLANNTLAKLRVAVPNKLADQPLAAQEAIAYAQARADLQVHELGFGAAPACYHMRNEFIVHQVELVIGFPRYMPTSPRNISAHQGGTWSTLRFAESVGRPFLVCPVRIGGPYP